MDIRKEIEITPQNQSFDAQKCVERAAQKFEEFTKRPQTRFSLINRHGKKGRQRAGSLVKELNAKSDQTAKLCQVLNFLHSGEGNDNCHSFKRFIFWELVHEINRTPSLGAHFQLETLEQLDAKSEQVSDEVRRTLEPLIR